MKYRSEYLKRVMTRHRQYQKEEQKELEEFGPDVVAAWKEADRKASVERRRQIKIEWLVALSEHPPVTIKLPDPDEPRPNKWYYVSDGWRDTAIRFQASYPYCQRCGLHAEEVHHTTYRNINTPEEWADLVSLCRFCHQDVHRHGSMSKYHEFTLEELALFKESKIREKEQKVQEKLRQEAKKKRKEREETIASSIFVIFSGIVVLSFLFGWDRITGRPNWLGSLGIFIILLVVVIIFLAAILENKQRNKNK